MSSRATLLTPQQLSDRWERHVSVKTLGNWRCFGEGPRFRKIGGRIFYPIEAVIAYETANDFRSTREYEGRSG